MVLTQTCDLVDRSGAYGAPYISVGAVRPLRTAISRETDKFKTNLVLRKADAIGERNKERVKNFLKSLLNNNNTEYFYIHDQATAGVADRYCVFLRMAISFKNEHYKVLKSARALSLRPQFQAKLGWLVGNIYSRVGTDDWVPKQLPEEEWNSLIDTIMAENVVALNEKKVDYVRKNNDTATIDGWDMAFAREQVSQSPEFKTRDEVIEIVTNELIKVGLLAAEAEAKARIHLRQSPRLKAKIPG